MPKLSPPDNLDPLNRDALERAIAITLADPDRAEHVQHKLTGAWSGDTWIHVAIDCAYLCQEKALGLASDEVPPCFVDFDDDVLDAILVAGPHGSPPLELPWGGSKNPYATVVLADRLINAGISLYEPDPLQALARKTRKTRKKR